jgi:hypothetical protein
LACFPFRSLAFQLFPPPGRHADKRGKPFSGRDFLKHINQSGLGIVCPGHLSCASADMFPINGAMRPGTRAPPAPGREAKPKPGEGRKDRQF